ncbi:MULTISPECIES: hypothetical protein [Acinetobacter]|uniref:hypothetical protein n=1 Tax=Acinetobacter TaxID=469 RepID=UPI000B3C626B|nr:MULTISPECIES: hypothetical protein [Acinetobacter]MCH7328962.1 hypothetical protein [Acinetobacter modestus]
MFKRNIVYMLAIVSFHHIAHAAPTGEKVAVCYIFKGDKIINHSPCILSTGYGAGGTYESMQIGKKSYEAETQICYDKKSDNNIECGISLNGKDATYYHRNLFYNKIDDIKLINSDSLSCYITKDKTTDICIKRN